MSQLNVDVITGRDGQGAPEFTKGAIITGVVTATTLNQNLSGDLTVGRNFKATGIATATGGFVGNLTGNASGLTGTPDITVGAVSAVTGTFSGNVSVGGTLTYEDVKNVDSVGLITARSGILVGTGKSVGIGTDMPGVPLEVHNTAATGAFINVKSKSNTIAGINFGDYEDDDIGSVRYGNGDNSLRLFANAGEKFRVGSAGQLGIGGATYGTSGHVLKSGGASAAPTWGAAPSGDCALISTGSPSSTVSSIIIDNVFSADYDIYKVYTWWREDSWIKARLVDTSGNVINGSNYQMTGVYSRRDTSGGNAWDKYGNHNQDYFPMSYWNGTDTRPVVCEAVFYHPFEDTGGCAGGTCKSTTMNDSGSIYYHDHSWLYDNPASSGCARGFQLSTAADQFTASGVGKLEWWVYGFKNA